MSDDTTVLQNIFFDSSLEGKLPVYTSNSDADIICNRKTIKFLMNGKSLSLRNLAQIFPNHHYSSNTSISNIFLKFGKITGSAQIKVFFNDGINAETLEFDQVINNTVDFISSPISLKKETGYFYIKITSLEQNTTLENIQWITDYSIPYHKVLIGITTFKREEALHANIKKIIKYDELRSLNIDLLIVDNGNTVDFSIYDYPIYHTTQDNSGGTGGFMRSLKYAKDNLYTHNMFMDDDIELEPEMLYRAVVFSLFTIRETTVGLMMMKKSLPYQVWEQGAFIDKHKIYTGYSFNYCLNADSNKSLTELNKNRASEFAGWWGCIVPTKIAPTLPYMFIKGDDVVSGMILTRMGVPCITLPTAMVWHEDFDKKPYTWQHFYDIRNAFMIRHFINQKTNRRTMVFSVAKLFLACVALGDYYRCELMLKAFQHGIKPADEYFTNIDRLKQLHNETMQHFPLKDVSGMVSSIVLPKSLKKGFIGAFLTFFGTLNPLSANSCSDGRFLTVPLNKYDFSHTFKYKNVVFYDPYTFKGYVCEKSFVKTVKLLFSFSKTSLKYMLNRKMEKQNFVVNDNYWDNEFSEVNISKK